MLRRVCALTIASSLWACVEPVGIERTAEGGAPSVDASAASSPRWCDVAAIFTSKCQRCHGQPLAHGAPFPLLTYQDTQQLDKQGKPRYERIATAVEAELMPPQFIVLDPAVEALANDERSTLLEWIAASAPAAESASCLER